MFNGSGQGGRLRGFYVAREIAIFFLYVRTLIAIQCTYFLCVHSFVHPRGSGSSAYLPASFFQQPRHRSVVLLSLSIAMKNYFSLKRNKAKHVTFIFKIGIALLSGASFGLGH